MKVSSKPHSFAEFDLTLTLENIEEAKILYFLFNYGPVVSLLNEHSIEVSTILDAIDSGCLGHDVNSTTEEYFRNQKIIRGY